MASRKQTSEAVVDDDRGAVAPEEDDEAATKEEVSGDSSPETPAEDEFRPGENPDYIHPQRWSELPGPTEVVNPVEAGEPLSEEDAAKFTEDALRDTGQVLETVPEDDDDPKELIGVSPEQANWPLKSVEDEKDEEPVDEAAATDAAFEAAVEQAKERGELVVEDVEEGRPIVGVSPDFLHVVPPSDDSE